jgi:branched-chain amino acid transport system ATP-binding protein
MSLLAVRDAHIAYGKAEAVFGVTIAAESGCITTIIGPNGAGKTTLLASIAGLLPMSSGSVMLDGHDISNLSVEARLERGLVLVPEKRELFPEMSVEDNLVLGAYHRRSSGARTLRKDLDWIFQLFPRLKERVKQSADTLSGGERQMLALGRALMSKPRLLMLDEPSLGLAPLITSQIFKIIAELRDGGVSVILVEQNARAALAVADYGYVIEQGRVAVEGNTDSLASDPKVAGIYLGHSEQRSE